MSVPWLPVILVDVFGSAFTLIVAVLCLYYSWQWKHEESDDSFRHYIFLLTAAIVLFAISRSVGHLVKQGLLYFEMPYVWKKMAPFSGSINTATFVAIFAISIYFQWHRKAHNQIKEYKNHLESLVESLKIKSTKLEIAHTELQEKNTEIENNRQNLKRALDEISKLITKVTKEGKLGAYYTNPNLTKCWEAKQCNQKQCPCYGKEPMRCWHVPKTHCQNEVQGTFENKHEKCMHCDFYKMSISDPIFQIGEQFNNMMHVLERNNKKLAAAYRKLKQSQATILQQEKMASVGQLAAGVAHEINNPVGFITSNLGTLGKYIERLKEFISLQTNASDANGGPESFDELNTARKKLKVDYILEDIPDLIKESLEGAERVKEIVQNLKSFSRVDQAETKPANINDCLESTLKIVWNELKYKCEVVKEYGDLPQTLCSPQQLNQVFVNLLVNAAHAIEKQGVITIKTWTADKDIYASISDTGRGIPQENLARLFEPFFTTKEVGKGTGLGLSIAYDIIAKKHHGEIIVDSEVGKGTTFTVRIPVVERK